MFNNEPGTLAIGVDLGGTKIASALVTADGTVVDSCQQLTRPEEGFAAVLERIAGQIEHLAGLATHKILGIGLGTPGQVYAKTGLVLNAVNLGWEEVNLLDELRIRLAERKKDGSLIVASDLPLWIQKDTNASAVGEYYFGAARNCPDFVYLGIGSGLGGGIIASGRLIVGANSIASDLGHLSLDPKGLPCACGGRGCAETIVSGPGLMGLVRRFLQEQRYPSILNISSDLSTQDVLAAARSGDKLSQAALAEVGRNLGIVMAACVSVLNPALVVIAGGLGLAAFDEIMPAALQEIRKRNTPACYQNLKVARSQLISSAVGAASLVWYFSSASISAERR